MTATTFELLKIRLISFGYQVGTALVVLAVGYFVSPDFANTVTEHFGPIVGGLVALAIPEIVKHFRNLAVLSAAANQLGGTHDDVRSRVTLI